MNTLEKKYPFSGTIRSDVYECHSSQLEWEMNATQQKIADLENRLFNQDVFIDKAMNFGDNLSK